MSAHYKSRTICYWQKISRKTPSSLFYLDLDLALIHLWSLLMGLSLRMENESLTSSFDQHREVLDGDKENMVAWLFIPGSMLHFQESYGQAVGCVFCIHIRLRLEEIKQLRLKQQTCSRHRRQHGTTGTIELIHAWYSPVYQRDLYIMEVHSSTYESKRLLS